MFNIDLYSEIPIYQQIVNEYKRLIINGYLDNDDKIPSIRELAIKLSINPSTVSRAYEVLEREGLIKTSRGRGTFIQTDKLDTERILLQIKDEIYTTLKNAYKLKISESDINKLVLELYKEFENEARHS